MYFYKIAFESKNIIFFKGKLILNQFINQTSEQLYLSVIKYRSFVLSDKDDILFTSYTAQLFLIKPTDTLFQDKLLALNK